MKSMQLLRFCAQAQNRNPERTPTGASQGIDALYKYWLVAIPRRPHPIPFRIRSLSSSGAMVVIPQGIVRVGRCQPLFSAAAITGCRFYFVGPVTCGKSSLPALAPKELNSCRLGNEAGKAMSAEPDRPDFPPVPPTPTRRQPTVRSAPLRCAAVEMTLPRSLYRFMREFWGVLGVIFSQPLLSKTFRRHAVQGTVRPEVIVPYPPLFYRLPGFLQVQKVMLV